MLRADELAWLELHGCQNIVTVQAVSHALTNDVFFIECARKKKFVFKRLNLQARSLKKRACEYKVQQLVYKWHMTPKVIATQGQYKLQEYIVGETPKSINHTSLKLLAMQLSIIHQLPAQAAPQQCLLNELKDLKKNSSEYVDEEKYAYYSHLASHLDKSSKKNVLCHGDLSLLNILETAQGEVSILDWEYAVLGCRAYDLASCSCINQLNKAQGDELFNYYYTLSINHLELDKVSFKKEYIQYLSLFYYINKLWINNFSQGNNREI